MGGVGIILTIGIFSYILYVLTVFTGPAGLR